MTQSTGNQATATGAPGTGRPVTIIEGTVYDTGLPLPPPMETATSAQAAPPSTVPQRSSVLRLLLGSAILVTEEVGTRLVMTPEEAARATHTPSAESVLRPLSEWDNQPDGDERYRAASYLAIGMTRDVATRAERLLRTTGDAAGGVATTASRLVSPIWNSFFLTPVRVPTQRLQARSEKQIEEWIARGKAESRASRALAEVSITGFVTESVTDLSKNVQVQGMINEVVASPDVQDMIESIVANQSTSIIGSILEEVRQRFLTIDTLLERPFRRLFGRARRETTLPEPTFRPAYVARRQTLYKGRSLEPTRAGYPAGFATRLAAFTIDMLIIFLAYTVATAFVTGTLTLFGLDALVTQLLSQSPLWQAAGATLIAIVGMSVVVGYGVFSWYLTGETLGDAIMGVQIVNGNGDRLSLGRAVRRIIGAFISALPLFLGFFWVLWDDRRQGWLDKIAGSHAVYDWPAVADEQFLREQYDRRGPDEAGT